MAKRLHDYDPADALTSDEAVEVFLADAIETSDVQFVAKAVGVVVRAKAKTTSSRETGRLHRQPARD